MDDILLLEEVERYLRGEMDNEERSLFETRRKNDAELDQLVVEHTYFLQGLQNKIDSLKYPRYLNVCLIRVMKENII